MKNRPSKSFFVTLMSVLALVYFLQTNLFDINWQSFSINKSYIVNFILASLVYVLILRVKEKKPHLTGFVFMAASFCKFLVFFLAFYPDYHLDGGISKIEFSTFFIPYIVSLFIEVAFLIKVLQGD